MSDFINREVKKVAYNHTVGGAGCESQYLDTWAHICPLLLKRNMKETYLGILLKSRFCFRCSLKRRPPCVWARLLRLSISNKFLGDVDSAGRGTTFNCRRGLEEEIQTRSYLYIGIQVTQATF